MAKGKTATLTNVQQSMGTAPEAVESFPETMVMGGDNSYFESEEEPKKQERQWYIFRLKRGSKNKVFIDGQEDVYDPKTKKSRRARLLNGVDTIWMDEQTHLDKDYVSRNRRSIEFNNRIAKIAALDTAALEFLRLHNGNTDTKKKVRSCRFEFEEHDPQKAALEAEKRGMQEFEALQLAMNTPVEEMRKHAMYLGVRFVDEFGEAKDQKLIRYEYVQKAKANPEFFINSFGSELVEVAFLVKKAVSQSKITVNGDKAYFGNGTFICSIPPAVDNVKHLISLASSKTKEGNEFLHSLKQYAAL